MDSRLSPLHHTVPLDDEQDEVSLGKIFATLWSYRRIILAGVVVIMGLYLVGALAGFMLLPRERLSSLGFRLVFDGVDDSKYPNGTKFSSSEIIATPVLTEVYAKDDLARYIGSFEKFKNSIFIRDANRDLELLDLEYAGRLADPKLAPLDRARIETDYKDKRKSLTAPFYSLTLRRNEWLTAMPPALAEKVLKDTLATWAQQIDVRKGALKYNIPMYSRASLQPELIDREDLVIAVDVLRAKTLAVVDTLDLIGMLPGASALRAGPDHLSLGELRAGLSDTLRFQLQPLVATIIQMGATTDTRRVRAYLENQLVQARTRQAEQVQRMETLQSSLQTYTGEKTFTSQVPVTSGQQPRAGAGDQGSSVIPQVSDSFLDRIMSLSKQDVDIKYRQEMTDKIIEEGLKVSAVSRDVPYYEELLRLLPSGGAAPAATVAAMRATTKSALESVAKGIDQMNLLYAELSAQNLNSQAMLYTISEPFADFSQRALAPSSILMYAALTLLLALFLVPLACLLHHTTVVQRAAAYATASDAAVVKSTAQR